MSEKHPGPLVVEGKLTDAERMKLESNYLRGTIAEDLNDGLTGGFKGDNFLLIRFHGMYQQDDRDIRACTLIAEGSKRKPDKDQRCWSKDKPQFYEFPIVDK